MSKRSVAFTKPEEPNFLKRLKQQIGYKEGPTVDTKREHAGPAEDLSDTEEEQPTVVVLNEGDLSADEAKREKERLEREAAEAPADLNSRIIFKVPKKNKTEEPDNSQNNTYKPAGCQPKPKKSERKAKKPEKSVLSFADEEDEEN